MTLNCLLNFSIFVFKLAVCYKGSLRSSQKIEVIEMLYADCTVDKYVYRNIILPPCVFIHRSYDIHAIK